jgi:hypothetical protein
MIGKAKYKMIDPSGKGSVFASNMSEWPGLFHSWPTLWNRLSQSIRAADNLPSFKASLKHIYFLNAMAILLM